jgi:hypothetical protein
MPQAHCNNSAIRMSPAIAARLTENLWDINDFVIPIEEAGGHQASSSCHKILQYSSGQLPETGVKISLVLNLEVFMRDYEIRVQSVGHTTAIIEEVHFSDHGAVRSAKKLAGDNPFEVWRGLDCVYATSRVFGTPIRDAL